MVAEFSAKKFHRLHAGTTPAHSPVPMGEMMHTPTVETVIPGLASLRPKVSVGSLSRACALRHSRSVNAATLASAAVHRGAIGVYGGCAGGAAGGAGGGKHGSESTYVPSGRKTGHVLLMAVVGWLRYQYTAQPSIRMTC